MNYHDSEKASHGQTQIVIAINVKLGANCAKQVKRKWATQSSAGPKHSSYDTVHALKILPFLSHIIGLIGTLLQFPLLPPSLPGFLPSPPTHTHGPDPPLSERTAAPHTGHLTASGFFFFAASTS